MISQFYPTPASATLWSQGTEASLLFSSRHNLDLILNTKLSHNFSVSFISPGCVHSIHTKSKHLRGLCSEQCEETLLAYLFLQKISSKTKRIVAETLPQLCTRSVTPEGWEINIMPGFCPHFDQKTLWLYRVFSKSTIGTFGMFVKGKTILCSWLFFFFFTF